MLTNAPVPWHWRLGLLDEFPSPASLPVHVPAG
jgi:hypothetical protein